jgi:hypothetical protein
MADKFYFAGRNVIGAARRDSGDIAERLADDRNMHIFKISYHFDNFLSTTTCGQVLVAVLGGSDTSRYRSFCKHLYLREHYVGV